MTRAETVRDAVVAEVARTGFRAHGLHVLVGDDDAEHRWTPDVREDVQSIAKGVCVIATGIAVADGAIDPDAPVSASLTDVDFGAGTDAVTLRHLLTMTSGVDLPWSPTLLTDWPDLAREFLGRPSHGRVFQYSNASTYTAMRVLGARVGDVGRFVQERLLTPLGIDDAEWERCPNGHIAGGGGLLLRTAEVARLGRLVRDGGRVADRQLVAPEWVAAMHGDWVAAGRSPAYERYALAGWDGPGRLWRMHGANGQLQLFDEAAGAVVTITADDHAGADAVAASVAVLLAGGAR
ncbi:hydrolase [Curtobacterium sp. MCJR17_055]|uniref:serine hydrolase domain-containing protein n=1 Tax=unclassified Curtobacterium TaxID=257496 RepID=UPI000D83A2A5|nr:MULTISPECIES: serine hydrolase domain-containing protein [unclassified Curtobacterium]PYY37989.1 hydrolase [Curtobacterium sp. MCBD17_029]PYY57015.1 hydrolase [Curtobacterium sp. MCJR17_055]PYY62069.1 hydrolase [Curtobacterium sp. MCPF17_015]WIB36150.1 serine hydrolase domain-containing protein [Curtobacterium sp. MCJR17_043]